MSHFWKLDESGSAYADSYGTDDASCSSCPTAVAGKYGNAQQFDGIGNEVNVADDNSFDWENISSFSIEFWMKTDAGNTCSGNQVIVGRDDSSTPLHWWVGCTNASGAATFNLRDTSGNDYSVTGSTDLTDGSWHHIVALRDAGLDEIRIYVDGSEEGVIATSYAAGFDSYADINIGWLNLTPYYHYSGLLDEVAIYNRALTDKEILQHYNDGTVGLELGYCACSADVINIMPLGDSITAGDTSWCNTDDTQCTGYRQDLYIDLFGASYQIDFVGSRQSGNYATPSFDTDHEGHGGYRDNQVAAEVYSWLTANPASVVLIHIGTNPPRSAINVEAILDAIDQYETDYNTVITVILALIIERWDPPSASVSGYNDDVELMANSRINNGDRIIIVDMEDILTRPDFNGPGDYSTDLFHPNDAGYSKMADTWLTSLETVLPVCSVPLEITSEPVTETGTAGTYSYDVNVSSGHSMVFNLLAGPSGMTINGTTGLIEWISYASSDIDVSVEAVNTTGSVSQDYSINVVEYPTDMIHYWKMDESARSVFHDFFGSNHARCSVCPSATAGKVDGGIGNGGIASGYGAQLFNGSSSKVNVTDDDTFDWGNTDGFTIEFWMKTAASSTCSGNQVIVGRDDSSTDLHWWVGCKNASGAAIFNLRDTSGNDDYSVTGSKDLTDGAWHHIVAVRNASTNRLLIYVDGIQEGSTAATYSTGFDSSVNLNIGWLNLTPYYHFAGAIDEVALYNRALSLSEIQQHYANGTSGNGYGIQITYAPDIHVTDSVLPNNDLQMGFAQVTEFQSSSAETVTITNSGNASLIVTNVQISGTNADQFALNVNGGSSPCAGTAFNVPAGGSCTVTVTFSPTSDGIKSANLNIASTDPDENPVQIALSGTGLESVVYAPEINVTDSIGASDDLQMNFGQVTEFDESSETVTISNTGNSTLAVSNVQLSGTNANQFALNVNGGSSPCAGTAFNVPAGSSCTVTVRFIPTSEGAKSATFAITSDDSDESTVYVALSGIGLSSYVNNPPTAPELVYPTVDQTGLETQIKFSWDESTDLNGDNITYDLYICQNDSASCSPYVTDITASLANSGIYYAGYSGTVYGLLLFGFVMLGSERGRKKLAMLITVVMISSTLLIACGSGGGGGGSSSENQTVTNPPAGSISKEINGLIPGTTYYWRVVAKDGNGGTTGSETRSFTTQ